MKALTCLLLLLAGTCGTALAADRVVPPTIAEVQKEGAEFLRALKGYTVAQRDEAVAASKARLADLDRHIGELEDEIARNWESMSQSARSESQASLRALRRQRNAVAEEYGRLQAGSAAAWEEMKGGFTRAYEELQQAWEKAEGEFGKR